MSRIYGGYSKLPVYGPQDELSMEEAANLSLRHLTSTDESPFLYKGHNDKFEERFKHETCKNKARFTDGNNGDYWRVIVVLPQHNRMLVQNLSQDFVCIMYWD